MNLASEELAGRLWVVQDKSNTTEKNEGDSNSDELSSSHF